MPTQKLKRARSRSRHTPGQMNKTEAAYVAEVLVPAFVRGEILGWAFESITLKLADAVRYTPDFMVQKADGTIDMVEVKACRKGGAFLSEDDSWVKLKVAKSAFAHLFGFVRAGKLAKADGGGWKFQTLTEDAS